jgi:hypothetical protein
MTRHFPLQVVQNTTDYKHLLLAKAFLIVHGMNYNRVSFELREKNRGRAFHLYETILPDGGGWDSIRRQIYPRLARYLHYKSVDPRTGKDVVVAVFYRDHFYLIGYPHLVEAYCEMEEIGAEAFHLRVKQWLAWGVS